MFTDFHNYTINSPSRTRTYDNAVNSRALYQLSYRGLFIFRYYYVPSKPHIRSASFPGQTLTRLVAVSSICCHTSTSALSTSSSLRGFPAFRHWTSHLEGGFALRCLQRLSLPGSATRRCSWQSSRYTGGQSAPVLSY